MTAPDGPDFVAAIRSAAPYLHAHHGRTFVIAFPGEICARDDFDTLLGDIALLSSLGVRLVLVHGARPQIDTQLALRGLTPRFESDLRVTDGESMQAVLAAIGILRHDIEARLTGSVAGSRPAGARLRVSGGSWVSAKPVGVRGGVDHDRTGLVRSVDIADIRTGLGADRIALLSPVGHSPTGETYNLRNADVAEAVAIGLGADKLVFMIEADPRTWRLEPDASDGQLTVRAASDYLQRELRERRLSTEDRSCVRAAVDACRAGVRRTHLIGVDGASPLLRELYTRDGCGLMITAQDDYESTRAATADDVPGIAELIAPLEQQGLLLPRSRERLAHDIDSFSVLVRDGAIIACNALTPYPDGSAEFACVAVHPDYRGRDLAAALLRNARAVAAERGLSRIFALTTRTPHWFVEHGFVRGTPADLPAERRAGYDHSRSSIVLVDRMQ